MGWSWAAVRPRSASARPSTAPDTPPPVACSHTIQPGSTARTRPRQGPPCQALPCCGRRADRRWTLLPAPQDGDWPISSACLPTCLKSNSRRKAMRVSMASLSFHSAHILRGVGAQELRSPPGKPHTPPPPQLLREGRRQDVGPRTLGSPRNAVILPRQPAQVQLDCGWFLHSQRSITGHARSGSPRALTNSAAKRPQPWALGSIRSSSRPCLLLRNQLIVLLSIQCDKEGG